MKNIKRIALCVLALTLVCQIAFASVDLSGAWLGKADIIGYKTPQVYCVIDGKEAGTIRFVIPNMGSASGIKGTFNWTTTLIGEEIMSLTVTVSGKTFNLAVNASDILLNKKGTKLTMKLAMPPILSLGGKMLTLNMTKGVAGISKLTANKPKTGVNSTIVVKTTPVTDYVVICDKDYKILGIADTVAQIAKISYDGWTKGKNIFYAYAGMKDGTGAVRVKSQVGDILTAEDMSVLTAQKKFVKKVAK